MPEASDNTETPMPALNARRVFQLGLFGVVVVSFVGYFVGIGPIPQSQLSQGPLGAVPVAASEGAPPAVAYAQMDARHDGPNRAWRTSLNHLVFDNVDPATSEVASVEMKQAALVQREARRAYNGAPPTVPHTIDQRSSAVCVACHQEGLRAEGVQIGRAHV